VLPPAEWPVPWALWGNAGIGHILVSLYPLDAEARSAIGLYRRLGRPPFTERERLIAHVVVQQVDWLHRDSAGLAARDQVLRLSPRERQVLVFLLAGHAQKEVADRLDLSPYTIGDYVKNIYRHFSVGSRAELLARFIAGGRAPE
jgi:DNA-binding NarL/FixJ family response regulator